MRRGAAASVSLGIILLAGLPACGTEPVRSEGSVAPAASSTTAAPGKPLVLLSVAGGDGGLRLQQEGTAAVRIRIVSVHGGAVTSGPGYDGGRAIKFPTFHRHARSYPRAVVAVSNGSSASRDPMDPGTKDLTWGADVELDETSWAARGVDNGDNVVQRGLSGETALFKAEVDHRHAACSVTGTAGTLSVRASEALRPRHWYQVRCERSGGRLGVFVTDLSGGGGQYARETVGAIGDISFPDPTAPLAIGGKIGQDGRIVTSATDQFNGSLDRPFLVVGRVEMPL